MRIGQGIIVCTLLWVSSWGCRTTQGDPEGSGSTSATRALGSLQVPLSLARSNEFVGQLFLPKKEGRKGGAVYLKLLSGDAAGKVVLLDWPKGNGAATMYRPDIHFDPAAKSQAEAKGDVVAGILDGWEKVSPLESLAAGRCSKDTTKLEFQGQTVSVCSYPRDYEIYVRGRLANIDRDGKMIITEEPELVGGTHYQALKKFGTPRVNGAFLYFDQAERLSNVALNPNCGDGTIVASTFLGKKPTSSFLNIDQSPAGKDGWFVYGTCENIGSRSVFVMRAFEPRSILRADDRAVTAVSGLDEAAKVIQYQENIHGVDQRLQKLGFTQKAFAQLENNYRKTSFVKEGNFSPFRLGEGGLVVHLFHWMTDGAGKKDIGPLGLVTGHFSLGFYEIVREPLTGDLQIEVSYRQVYGQGPDAVLSGKMARHEYMGSLVRGWSNTIAVSDVLIRAPWMYRQFDVSVGDQGEFVVPRKVLDDSLSLIMQGYRTGSGEGFSSITPWASCVQDSSQALFIALRRIEASLQDAYGKDLCNVRDLAGFCNLERDLMQNFTANKILQNAPVRADWEHNALRMDVRRATGEVGRSYAALLSYQTALPREAFNNYLKIFLEHGAELLVMDNVQIGGYWTAEQKSTFFNPVPATTLVPVVHALLAKENKDHPLTEEELIQMVLKLTGAKSLSQFDSQTPQF